MRQTTPTKVEVCFALILFAVLVLLALTGCAAPSSCVVGVHTSAPAYTGAAQTLLSDMGSGEDIEVVRVQWGPIWSWDRESWAIDCGTMASSTFIVEGLE